MANFKTSTAFFAVRGLPYKRAIWLTWLWRRPPREAQNARPRVCVVKFLRFLFSTTETGEMWMSGCGVLCRGTCEVASAPHRCWCKCWRDTSFLLRLWAKRLVGGRLKGGLLISTMARAEVRGSAPTIFLVQGVPLHWRSRWGNVVRGIVNSWPHSHHTDRRLGVPWGHVEFVQKTRESL